MQGATYRAAVECRTRDGRRRASPRWWSSKAPGLAPGDLVFADTGWQEYAALPAQAAQQAAELEPITHLLSVYGIAGLTAYFGLLDVGQPKAGETVVVSAAAGSVGSIVGQIAKIKGCRVVGIAGGAGEVRLADRRTRLRRRGRLQGRRRCSRRCAGAAPDGIDVYFDNVGGDILEACLSQMNLRGRIACCGAVSQYDGAPPATGRAACPG